MRQLVRVRVWVVRVRVWVRVGIRARIVFLNLRGWAWDIIRLVNKGFSK